MKKYFLPNGEIEINQLIKSNRKSISLEINENAQIILRLPFFVSEDDEKVKHFIFSHENWIEKQLKIKKQNSNIPISDDEVARLKEMAKNILPKKIEIYSNLMGLFPTGIKITSAQKRFGSCSSKNGLCFSYILMKYPNDAIDYVVVHELAHIKYKNHGKDFYNLIEKFMPDYRERAKTLKK